MKASLNKKPGLHLKEGTSGIRVPIAEAGPLVAIDKSNKTATGTTPDFNQNSTLRLSDAAPEKG